MSVPAISRCSAARNGGRCRTRRAAGRRPAGRAPGSAVAVIDGMAITTTSAPVLLQHLLQVVERAEHRGAAVAVACLAGSSSRNPTGVSPKERTRRRSRASARAGLAGADDERGARPAVRWRGTMVFSSSSSF